HFLNSIDVRSHFIMVIGALLVGASSLSAQTPTQDTIVCYPLQIDLPLFDIPFQRDAARAGELFDSYSMQQALAVTQNLHRVNYHFDNKLWQRIIRPDNKRRRVYNRIAANITSGLVDYAFTY